MSWRVPLAHYPGMNPFVLDWLGGDGRFLARGAGVMRSGRALLSPELARALEESNRRWGIFPDFSGDTVRLVAGQQVGFAGGPLYTLAKLATLIRMKRDLEKTGTAVTAFFWLATEDHDFDEVAQLNVPTTNQQLDLLSMRAVRTTESRAVVGPLPVPDSLIAQFLTFFQIERPDWLREGVTFGGSFAELIASVCGNEVVLVDALLPELRRAGAPLFEQIVGREDEVQHALGKRSEELESAGYSEQVVARDGERYTLLFDIDEHGVRHSTTQVKTPERTSTSALTRPLLQDFVLQPDVFIGGPAEVAYYAQLAPLHELLGVPMPRIALRGHALVAPKRITRAFERYAIEPGEIFSAADTLLAEREPEGVARVREIADDGKRALLQRIEAISELALPADHSLAGSIQRSIGHLEFHFNKLAERAIKGLVRKDRERYAATRELVATLFPDRHVQDRVVSWFAYHHTFGNTLLERLVEEIEPDSDHFRIIDL